MLRLLALLTHLGLFLVAAAAPPDWTAITPPSARSLRPVTGARLARILPGTCAVMERRSGMASSLCFGSTGVLSFKAEVNSIVQSYAIYDRFARGQDGQRYFFWDDGKGHIWMTLDDHDLSNPKITNSG